MSLFKKNKKEEKKTEEVSEEKQKTVEPERRIKKQTPKKALVEAYQIIREPHITEKATYLGERNKYIFKIYPKANKIEVKKAIESLYPVKVEKVNIIHSAPKKRRLGKFDGWRQGLKKGYWKAVVTLKKGDKIEIIPG
jgi:large subunit ribosomal protein L23